MSESASSDELIELFLTLAPPADFLEVGDAYIYPGEGGSIQEVKFRLIVFRPFIGEIMTGTVRDLR